jgi:hypothetical protein
MHSWITKKKKRQRKVLWDKIKEVGKLQLKAVGHVSTFLDQDFAAGTGDKTLCTQLYGVGSKTLPCTHTHTKARPSQGYILTEIIMETEKYVRHCLKFSLG